MRAFDSAGNQSDVVCVDITTTDCLTMTLVSPGQGAVVGPGLGGSSSDTTSAPFDVVVNVTAQESVTSVEVYIDPLLTETATGSGTRWTAAQIYAAGFQLRARPSDGHSDRGHQRCRHGV